MCSAPEELSSIKINDKIKNKPIIKMDYTNEDSVTISLSSRITDDSSKIIQVKDSIKNKIRPHTPTLFLNNKKTLYIEKKMFIKKENSVFSSFFLTKKNENKENNENTENKKIEVNKIEINKNKTEIKEEETINYINKIKVNGLNSLKTSENCTINKNRQKIKKKKIYKDDNYTQTYCRNDFCDRPPKISKLFMEKYDYENKNIFSHSNDTSGNIKESKKTPHFFYDHLLIKNVNNERFITTSLNKRGHKKLLTLIFFSPRTISA